MSKLKTYKVGDAVYYIKQIGVVLESNTFEHFRENDIKKITTGSSLYGGDIIEYITKESGTEMSSYTRSYCWGYGDITYHDNNSYYKVLIGNKKMIMHESEFDHE